MVRSDALFRRESVRVREKTKAKNPAPYGTGFFLFNAWQFPTHMGRPHTTIGATAFHF